LGLVGVHGGARQQGAPIRRQADRGPLGQPQVGAESRGAPDTCRVRQGQGGSDRIAEGVDAKAGHRLGGPAGTVPGPPGPSHRRDESPDGEGPEGPGHPGGDQGELTGWRERVEGRPPRRRGRVGGPLRPRPRRGAVPL